MSSADIHHDMLHGTDIAKMLGSQGPIVKCVLLRAPGKDDKQKNADGDQSEKVDDDGDKKPKALENGQEQEKPKERTVLIDLIDEIGIDTTPSKSMVAKTLGGSFTFLGQYEDEGTVLMVRDLPEGEVPLDEEEIKSLKLSELRAICKERGIQMDGMLEKSELVKALMEDSQLPPINPHSLQPPLHKAVVRGDILVLKVAATNEVLDGENNNADEEKEVVVPTNEEFFLDYTKDEYVKFASRTDIEEHEVEEPDNNEEEEDGDEEENGDDDDSIEEGEPYEVGQGEEIEEEDKSAMFNLVMNEVLRQYREEHGRGPNTQELLELRASIAKELDVEVAKVPASDADWDKKAKENSSNSEKKIGFHTEDKILEFHPDPNEHSHHHEPDFDDDGDHDVSDDEEEEDNIEGPPKKKLKMDQNGDNEEEEDSKPAAIETEPSPGKGPAETNGDTIGENGDDDKR